MAKVIEAKVSTPVKTKPFQTWEVWEYFPASGGWAYVMSYDTKREALKQANGTQALIYIKFPALRLEEKK